jgi:SAM-dependent methyltransferase
MTAATNPYDQQAAGFDQRTGVMQPELIAQAIETFCPLGSQARVLEIGCGTGQIDGLLAQRFKAYVGIDLSAPMLEQFRQAHPAEHGILLQSDGNKDWPMVGQSADIIFSSRAIHWLDAEHVVNQVYRIGNSHETLFIVGRVKRAKTCWAAKLRKQCHKLLKQQQLQPRDGQSHLATLNDLFTQRGAHVGEPCVVNQWQQQRSLQQALDDWANKPGLAGIEVPTQLKQQILSELKQWANDRFGPQLPLSSERQYLLYPIKIIR